MARNVTMADVGFVSSSRYLIHDRDSKFCESFHQTIEAVGVAPVKPPARSSDLNSFAERWVGYAATANGSTDGSASGQMASGCRRCGARVDGCAPR